MGARNRELLGRVSKNVSVGMNGERKVSIRGRPRDGLVLGRVWVG